MAGDDEPHHTLYINNLPDKLKREQLRRLLYELFSPFGVVLDVVNHRTLKMRGQAFVAFRDVPSAESAMAACQGRDFMGKPMRIAYARSKSNAVAKMDGTYVAKQYTVVDRAAERRARRIARKQAAAEGGKGNGMSDGENSAANDGSEDGEGGNQGPAKPGHPDAMEDSSVNNNNNSAIVPENNPPNKTILVRGLPADIEKPALEMLFRRFEGYEESRLVPARQVAFVDYGSVEQASAALEALQAFKVTPTHALVLSFAK